jgi:uncharacterized iron-regulated protein
LRRWLASAALLAGCAPALLLQDHPLAGRIWDVRAQRFVEAEAMLARAATARYVILGETHDNPEHHRLQRDALEALAARGAPRALAMEQFDSEHQKALDAAQARGADAEALADAGHFDREGWGWAMYRPLVEFARQQNWPLLAGNLSRAEARGIVAEPSRSGLPPAEPRIRQVLEADMVHGHCGSRPDARRLAAMVEAQRARDARLAQALATRSPGVLITGNGHARRDAGVPLYLPRTDLVSIAILEVEAGKSAPQDYAAESFDYLWFTPRQPRRDPCAR